VQADRTLATTRLSNADPSPRPPERRSREQIQQIITALGGLLKILKQAAPEDKSCVYRLLGLKLTYRPHDRTVLAETQPSAVCAQFVSEGGLAH